jgi:hypothetical protein
MWIKPGGYRSFFIMVRVRVGEGFRIPIPIPLFLLDQTLDIMEDWAWLVEKFKVPSKVSHQPGSGKNGSRPWAQLADSPWLAVRLCRKLIGELRRYGKWRMVEVDARDPKSQKQVRVYVDFI